MSPLGMFAVLGVIGFIGGLAYYVTSPSLKPQKKSGEGGKRHKNKQDDEIENMVRRIYNALRDHLPANGPLELLRHKHDVMLKDVRSGNVPFTAEVHPGVLHPLLAFNWHRQGGNPAAERYGLDEPMIRKAVADMLRHVDDLMDSLQKAA